MVDLEGDTAASPRTSLELAKSRHEAAQASEHSRRSAARVIEVEQILAKCKAHTFALEQSLAEQTAQLQDQQQRLDRADRVMAAMKTSLSWRITAPLRALKQRR